MEQTDSTVIATALPAIARDLGTNPIALKLALTAYLVSLAIFIPVSGWMADRFGAKRVFMAAIALFITSSLACSHADSLGYFVVARFVQGMGGAMMTPVARLVVVRGTPRSELVAAMAWLTIPALMGPLIGPPLGGFITTYFSWEWIFIINVPIGLIGIVATLLFLPDIPGFATQRMDWIGFFLVGFSASGILFGLSVISLPALPLWVGITAAISGAICGLVYVAYARRAANPILSPALMANSSFRASIVGGSLFRIGIGAVPFLMPLMLQLGFGFTPFQSGAITFTGAIGAIAMKFGAVRIFARFGFKRVLITTAVLSALTMTATALIFPETPIAWLYAILLAGGFTRSLFFTGSNALAFADVEDVRASQATAFSAVAQQVSIAVGVAFAGGVLETSVFLHGGELRISDFHTAFVAVGAAMLLGVLPFLGISRNAGSAALRASPGRKGGDAGAAH